METSDRDGDIDRRVMNNIRFNARRLARRLVVPGMSVEDYEQELLLDLLHRRKAFDPKLASFATFADRIIRHRISTLASPTIRLKWERRAVSLAAPARGEHDEEGTFLDLLPNSAPPIDESVAIRIDVGRFIEQLPTPLFVCCEVLLAESISEGARAAGIHRCTVYERARRLRERALAQGLAIYVAGTSDTFGRSAVNAEHGSGAAAPALDNQGHLHMGTRPRFPAARPPLSETDFRRWLGHAEPGDTLEYHRGFLAHDLVAQSGRLPECDRAELGRTAQRALWASERGLVHLVQRRHREGDYSYLLVARRKSAPQPIRDPRVAEVA